MPPASFKHEGELMKIGNVEVNGPAQEVLVLPRIDGDVIIRAQAVLDMGPFDAMCPEPKAPAKLVAGGFEKDSQNKSYLDQVKNYNETRFAYICVKSLEPSEIKWEQVDLGQPSTWAGWTKELSKAGLSSVEINRIVVCIMQANALDEHKLKMAREVFLAGQGSQVRKSSGQNTEPRNTSSGKHANDSE